MKNGMGFRLAKIQHTMEERALTTLTNMIRARGITVDAPERLGNPLDETKMVTLGGQLVIFSEKSRVSKQELQNYITFASENGYKQGLIVVAFILPSDDVMNSVRRYIEQRDNPLVQVFDYRHLQFDITTHRKVPRHRILTDDERAQLERLYPGDPAKVHALIDCQDPMAKWIGARPGDILEITRFSPTAGSTPYYRYCVADSRRAR